MEGTVEFEWMARTGSTTYVEAAGIRIRAISFDHERVTVEQALADQSAHSMRTWFPSYPNYQLRPMLERCSARVTEQGSAKDR